VGDSARIEDKTIAWMENIVTRAGRNTKSVGFSEIAVF